MGIQGMSSEWEWVKDYKSERQARDHPRIDHEYTNNPGGVFVILPFLDVYYRGDQSSRIACRYGLCIDGQFVTLLCYTYLHDH
jgi:hypothetical protein